MPGGPIRRFHVARDVEEALSLLSAYGGEGALLAGGVDLLRSPQVNVESQLEGPVLQGFGHALYEEMLFAKSGRCVNPRFFDYKIPSALDAPRIAAILVPSEEPTGPWGAKSISEIGINRPLPAISNAIDDALGVRIRRAPFAAERVFAACSAAERRWEPGTVPGFWMPSRDRIMEREKGGHR